MSDWPNLNFSIFLCFFWIFWILNLWNFGFLNFWTLDKILNAACRPQSIISSYKCWPQFHTPCRSRKRRTSENLNDVDEEVMTECSAAMLLMKLSCSPQQGGQQPFQPIFGGGGNSLPTFDQFGKPSYPNQSSPVDSSGASSFRSATPSPPLSSSTGTSTADEGIVKDMFTEPPKSSRFNYKPVRQ